MRKEFLMEMSGSELDGYAKVLGLDTTKAKAKARKIDIICSARERTAEIDVLGLTLSVPIKRLHDKRITDKLNAEQLNDAQLESLMCDILGKEQLELLQSHCTDEDGTIDVDAMAYAFNVILTSSAVKNF